MRPLRFLYLAFLSVLLAGQCLADGRPDGSALKDSSTARRARVVQVALGLRGIQEVGRNAGRDVERIIHYAGGTTGDKWCSWTVVAIMRWAHIPVPRFGLARSWFDAEHTIWRRGHQVRGKPLPQPADVLGFDWGLPDICHAETLVGPWGTGPAVRSVGGNTGDSSRKGEPEGVYENWRLKRSIVAVANVVDNPHYRRRP